MTDFDNAEFIPMLETLVFPLRSHLAGSPNYLSKESRESYRQKFINELLPRNGKLKRYESWYLGYYLQPYMQYLSKEQYIRRWADVQDNMHIITEENQISPGDITVNDMWLVRFSEILAESQFRGGVPSNKIAFETILSNIALNRFSHPERSIRQFPYIFKFGKLEHMQEMKESGKIRLANSSSYLSTSLNHGQKDDENNFTFTVLPDLLKKVDGQTGLAAIDPISKSQIINITYQEKQDYLMWCAAHKYDSRIPHAFDAEAVVVITQPRRFRSEVTKALKAHGLYATLGKVRYFDPYLDLETKLDVRFSKHFRFSYQNEYRIVAQGRDLPNYLFLELPGLSEYCEVHSLI